MELVASIVSSVLVETCRLLGGSVFSNIHGTLRYRSKIKNLEKEVKNLIDLRNNVDQDLESADRDGKIPTAQVTKWLQEVDEIMTKVNSLQEKVEASKKSKYGCLFHCRRQYKLARKAVEFLKRVEGLKKSGTFPAGLVAVNHQARTVKHIPGPKIEDQASASKNLAELLEMLGADGNRRIGVWGMGGVGKTTLVKTLNNKLKKTVSEQPFSMVIWATVTRDLDLRKIQAQIAERLNMEVRSEESVGGLAIRLHERLEKEKKFLLILDDLWQPIDLDHLGVPNLEDHKGSKIIFTSRSFDVCRGMKTDANIKVNNLNDEEAWKLFDENAGNVVNSEHIRPFAKAIAGECGGLPLAIITMGKAMRGKENAKLWKHALNELRGSVPCNNGIEEKVYKPLKWSYDTLEGNNIKSCFLFCCLFPEDFSIEVSELAQCWVAEGLIDEQHNYEESLNRTVTLLESLKDSCLLEEGARKGTVKMHDLVRDVAIWIASSPEDECKSLVMSGTGLNEISGAELASSPKRYSFMNNNIKRLPDIVTPCSEAKTLFLQGNLFLDTIPENFLIGFRALRVLNLSGTRVRSLPVSLLQLNDIRALLLRECYYLEKLPHLGDLSLLEILDLCATSIRELPRGLEKLSNLSQLNLSRTHYLRNIQAGTIARLSSLEVLDMTLSDYHWGTKEKVKEGQATFDELVSLKHLIVLSVRLNCIPSFGSEVLAWKAGLRRFQFFIGKQTNSLPTRYDKRRLTISGLSLSEEWIGWLLSDAKSLVLNHCWGLDQMLETLTIDSDSSFDGLKSLTISNSSSSLRPAGGCAAHFDMLPNLEELCLDNLDYLGSISELVGHLGLRFSRLRVMKVTRCHRLKNLLSYGSFILSLPSLEEIEVSFCSRLEELFSYFSKLDLHPEPVLPSLRIMELKELPKLRSLCKPKESWGHVERVSVLKCNRLKTLPLTSQNANTIKEITGELQWWNQLEWQDGELKQRLQPCFKLASARSNRNTRNRGS